jgi:hypothetical protein
MPTALVTLGYSVDDEREHGNRSAAPDPGAGASHELEPWVLKMAFVGGQGQP